MDKCHWNKDEDCTHCNDRCSWNSQKISQEQMDYEDWKEGQ